MTDKKPKTVRIEGDGHMTIVYPLEGGGVTFVLEADNGETVRVTVGPEARRELKEML